MNHSRVEAFTDAVVAIIMTIMVLEFKTPNITCIFSNYR
ncbi:TMEM175 family protein [Secundilactobacillus similis]|nr:TMEM175 family protein [Secundilactobacillus similis]